MSRAYYNENDAFAAAWLRELIVDGLIAPGDVDERSIEDVTANDLRGYDQHHFFAGIGVWSLALRCAGWSDDRSIWTGSCPCQPFSEAGKGAGFADERHLWPAFFHLVRAYGPECVIGEQVASSDGLAWLDLVQSDLEASRYAFGAVDTCAAGFGAPHIRQRLYWMAIANEGQRGRIADSEERKRDRAARGWIESDGEPEPCGEFGRSGSNKGLWRDVDWLHCRDGKWRPVEPGTFPLADAGAIRNRMGKLRGSGNALNVAQAQAFIESIIEIGG